MREYQNKDLESIISQITDQLEQLENDPSALADHPNMIFMNAAKYALMAHGFDEEQALNHASKISVEISDSGLSHSDIVSAAQDLIDSIMRLMTAIKQQYNDNMYNVLLNNIFYNANFNYG